MTPEGALALKFNALVRRRSLRRALRRPRDWPTMSFWPRRKRQAADGARAAILAGVCEAVIAALYIDGGFEVARAFIERYWANDV